MLRNNDIHIDVKDEPGPSASSIRTSIAPLEIELENSPLKTNFNRCKRVTHLAHSAFAATGSAVSGNLFWLSAKASSTLLNDGNPTKRYVGMFVILIACGLGTITALAGVTSLCHLKNALGCSGRFFSKKTYRPVPTQEPDEKPRRTVRTSI